MASYVRYIESFGARVVPLINEEDPEITEQKVKKLNGVLFPGGGGDNLAIGKRVFESVKKINDDGQFYPAWGTCLGYENMVIYTADISKNGWTEGLPM